MVDDHLQPSQAVEEPCRAGISQSASEDGRYDVFDIRGLVDDQLPVERQQAEIRKHIVHQQMVIDHEDIRGVEPPVVVVVKAAAVEGTRAPAAVLGIPADLPPELGREGEIAPLTRFGIRQPLTEAQVKLAAPRVLVLPLQADVVVLSLEDPEREFQGQGLFQKDEILLDQLILEGQGRGGDGGLLARKNRGDEICKGLSNARPRLDQQALLVQESIQNFIRHLALLRAVLIPRKLLLQYIKTR